MRRPPLALVAALATYFLLRGLILATAFDSVALPKYELFPMGDLAKIAHDGWRGPGLDHYYDNCGGHLATGLFAVPFFALFGDTYLALKLVPLLLGAGTLVLIWALVSRYFGKRAATIAVFAFALGPPTLTKYSMLAKGNHFESLFFQLLCCWLFFRMHEREHSRASRISFGLAAGFSVFFYTGSLIILVLLALTHLLVRGPRKSARDAALLVPPVLVGALPLLWLLWATSGRPTTLFKNFVKDSAPFVERVADLFTDKLPRAGVYPDLGPLPGGWAETALVLLFASAWLSVAIGLCRVVPGTLRTGDEAQRFRALAPLPFVLYLPLFAGLYAIAGFRFAPYAPPVEVGQFRYLIPHFTFTVILYGVACASHLGARGIVRRNLGAVMGTAGVALAAFLVPLVDWSFERTDPARRYEGHDLAFYTGVFLRGAELDPETDRLGWDFAWIHAELGEFEGLDRHRIAFGLGHHLAWATASPGGVHGRQSHARLMELDSTLARFPDQSLHVDLARGAGSFLRKEFRDTRASTDEIHGRLRALSTHPLAPYVVEGLCMDIKYVLQTKTASYLRTSSVIERAVPENLRWAWRRGQGFQCGRLLARGIASDVALVLQRSKGVSKPEREEFWFGVGQGLAQHGSPESVTDVPFELVPPAYQSLALRGFGSELRHLLGARAYESAVPGWEATLAADVRRHFLAGAERLDYPAPVLLEDNP